MSSLSRQSLLANSIVGYMLNNSRASVTGPLIISSRTKRAVIVLEAGELRRCRTKTRVFVLEIGCGRRPQDVTRGSKPKPADFGFKEREAMNSKPNRSVFGFEWGNGCRTRPRNTWHSTRRRDAFAANRPWKSAWMQTRQPFWVKQPFPRTRRHSGCATMWICRKCVHIIFLELTASGIACGR